MIPHIGIYFNAQELQTLKALSTAPSHAYIYNYLIISADAMLGYEIGMGSYDSLESQMHDLSLMWSLTGDVRYLNQLKTWSLWLAAQTDWGIPEWGQEPFTAAATSMAFTYDVIYDYLTPAERTTITNKWIQQVNAFYNFYLPTTPVISANYPNVSNMLIAAIGISGLALKNDYSGASAWVAWAKTCAQYIFTQVGGTDGGWREGPNYANTFRYPVAFLDVLKRVNGDNQFDYSFLRNLPYFSIWCVYNDNLLPVEDTDWSSYWHIRAVTFYYRLATAFNDSYINWLASRGEFKAMEAAQWGGASGTPLCYLYMWKNTTTPITPPNDLPLIKEFPSIGYVFYRTGWTNTDAVLLFKSGMSWGHAHADQNSWSLYGADGTISGNPGYLFTANDNQTKNSNTILSKGMGQAQEPGDWATAPLGTRGVIEQVDIKTNYLYVRGDAHAPYINHVVAGHPEESSGDLSKWIRSVIVVKNPFYFIIFDDVAAPQPEQIDWNLLGNGGTLTINNDIITSSRGIKVAIVEPFPFTATLVANTRTDVNTGNTLNEPMMRVRNPTDVASVKFLTAIFKGNNLPLTEIRQGNLIGVKVNVDAKTDDFIFFSSDGLTVNQTINLGKTYLINGQLTDTLVCQFSEYLMERATVVDTSLKCVGYLSEYNIWHMENEWGHPLTDIRFDQMTHCVYSAVKPVSATDPTIVEYAGYPWTYLQRVISAAHAKNCKVMISLDDMDSAGTALGPIIDNPTLRAQLITNLKNLVVQYGADGIDIDWEAESSGQMSTARYDTLVNDLYAALNPIGKIISVYYGSYFYSQPYLLLTPSVANSKLAWMSIGCYPYYKPTDAATRMNLWAGLGYNKRTLLLGIYVSGYAIPEYQGKITYAQIISNYNPLNNQDHVSATVWPAGSFGAGTPVQNGVIYWFSPSAVRTDMDWVIGNSYGGMMLYDCTEDKMKDSRSLLQNIFEELKMANVFGPGAVKTARAPVTVLPAGLNCQGELFLGFTDINKAATSGKISFVSTGAVQQITFPITMPTAPGTYNVYMDIWAEGYLLVAFLATDPVIIPSGTVGPPVWS